MLRTMCLTVLSVLALAMSTCSALASAGVCEREIASAASKYGVPTGILYSVGLTETGRKGSLQPYAMNIEGKAYFGQSVQDVLTRFGAGVPRAPSSSISAACRSTTTFTANISALPRDARPAQECRICGPLPVQSARPARELDDGVARYHAGPNNDPAQKKYVCRVIANLVATGYGKWTPNAQQFCR